MSDDLRWVRHPLLTDYAISECGDVRRITNARTRFAGHLVKGQMRGGYRAYKLVGPDGRKTTYWAHRLVAECFIGPRPSTKHVIAHWDGDRLNNHFSNVRWATSEENGADTARHGTLKGIANGRAVLSPEQVKQIRSRPPSKWGDQSALAREFGISRAALMAIVSGRNWTHV